MMKRYNDYENIVYGYLNNYTQFVAKSKNIELEISLLYDKIEELNDIKTTKYDKILSSSSGNSSSVEQVLERKIKIEEQIKDLRMDKKQIDTVLNRIDNAINSLRTPDKIIITERFIHEAYWKDISEKVGYSERTCQRMALEAMEKIVKNLFSKPEYEQGRLNFIFVDN